MVPDVPDVLLTQAYPTMSSGGFAPVGVRVGNATVVEVAGAFVKALLASLVHVVKAPRPEENSWTNISVGVAVTEPDNVTLIVEAPVAVTVPIQSSISKPSDASVFWCRTVHVVAPPPDTEPTVTAELNGRTPRTITSPMF